MEQPDLPDLPEYWMPRPMPGPDPATQADFDRLLAAAVEAGPDQFIDYQLGAPKWQFLCHAADRGGFVLHGTGKSDITIFEPRQSNDVNEFGNRRAVYAASDGLWPMYFAILDRDRYAIGLLNASIRVVGTEQSFYYFSITGSALEHQPWRDGVVYLLPADTFEAAPPITIDGRQISIAQVASTVPVRAAAKLMIKPADFPFLQDIHGHDNDEISSRAAADPDGFPWSD